MNLQQRPKSPASRKPKRSSSKPSPIDKYQIEEELYSNGISMPAGVDEAGRGPLAGPVVAASVILPRETKIEGIRDSKKLSPKRREILFDQIQERAVAIGIGIVQPSEIDEINILQAALKAMRLAVGDMGVSADYLLIDGINKIGCGISERPVTGGDDISASIGAASIIAKVTRDRMMALMDEKFPGFTFSSHKGYGTARHYDELRRFGPTPIHRRTFLKNFQRANSLTEI